MTRITKFLARTISLRLSLMVLVALATLLMAALFIMFCYSRKAVKEEALQKADQTLETIIQSIDNVMLSVEQSSGNIYWKMMAHQGKPEKIELYRKKLIEFNPYIIGCSVILDSTFNAILESFTKANDLSEGLGLGLPLTKRHVTNLGGELILDTSYKAGCRFIIQLPKVKS